MTAAVTRTTPPALLVKVLNPVMRRVLCSPLHRGASKSLLLLHLTGRKSGHRYDIPAGSGLSIITLIPRGGPGPGAG